MGLDDALGYGEGGKEGSDFSDRLLSSNEYFLTECPKSGKSMMWATARISVVNRLDDFASTL